MAERIDIEREAEQIRSAILASVGERCDPNEPNPIIDLCNRVRADLARTGERERVKELETSLAWALGIVEEEHPQPYSDLFRIRLERARRILEERK